MKINFTKKEYQTLVEMLLVADWIIRGHETEPREETKRYNDLRKKILAFHKEMGMAHEFRYEPKYDDYFETSEYERESDQMRFIDEYDEQSFWSMLSSKLAHRELASKAVIQPELQTDREKRTTELFALIDRYEEELSEHGLDNVRLVPRETGSY